MAKAIINLIILEVFSFFMRLTDTAKVVKIRNMDIFSSDRRQFYQHLGILAYKKSALLSPDALRCLLFCV